MHKPPVLYGLLFILTFAVRDLCAADKEPPFVSMIALVSTPREYDSLKIHVSGWLYFQMEDSKVGRAWLFPSPNHVRVHDFPSSITIDEVTLIAALKNRYRTIAMSRLHGAYIVFTGTFSANNPKAPGNLGLGEIREVVEVNGLEDVQEEQPKEKK